VNLHRCLYMRNIDNAARRANNDPMSSDNLTKPTPTEDKLDSLISLVQQVAADVKSLNTRVDSLEQKVDARMHETRPIWEGVLMRLETLEIEMDKVRSISHDTRADVRELRRELKEHFPAFK
jgi:hypothetical protein